MQKTIRRVTEVFVVIENNLKTGNDSILFIECDRLAAEEDIERYADKLNPNLSYRIQIEKIYCNCGILWEEIL